MKATITSKPRLEDIQEATELDLRAAHTSNPDTARSLQWLANVLRKPLIDWPVDDSPRSSYNEWHCVIDEIDELYAYCPAGDTFVRVPVRVAFQGGLTLEIGPFDLDAKDISVLRRAILAYDQHVAALHQGEPIKPLYESPSIEPNDDGSIVDLNAHRNPVS